MKMAKREREKEKVEEGRGIQEKKGEEEEYLEADGLDGDGSELSALIGTKHQRLTHLLSHDKRRKRRERWGERDRKSVV